jgi:hypothetical protein
MRRPLMTQYNVEFPREPGTHAKLTRLLLDEKIDFQSMITATVGGKTMIQFLAPKDAGLRERLDKMGIAVREELIFQLEMPHHHWELHKLAKSLADKDINILSLYSVVEGENMRILLSVDQPANAVALIEKLGYNPDYSIYDRDAIS